MDLPRFFLLTALAVVSYLLLLQWNEDYPSTPPRAQQPDATISALPDPADTDSAIYEPPLQVPEMTAAEVNAMIADYARVLKRFAGVTARRIGPRVYELGQVPQPRRDEASR
jgi:YidC/Oxa1 family membrane protein insertase